MINLIPIEKKKKNALYFYYRIIRISFYVFCLSLFIAVLSILPAYFLSSVKKSISSQKLEAQKLETIPKLDEETVSVLNSVNNKLDLIENIKDKNYLISDDVIKEVVSRKTEGIKITRISFEKKLNNEKTINVEGVAKSREQLLLFRESFEGSVLFKKVDLPISNFVKGSNIQFSLTIIPA